MIRNSDFILKRIHNTAFLLPTGQAMTDFKPGLSLNEVGIFLWEQLDKEKTEEELLQAMYAKYEPKDTEKCILQKDLSHYLTLLKKNNAICDDTQKSILYPDEKCFFIGGLFVLLHAPAELIHDNLLPFEAKNPFKGAACEITIILKKPSSLDNGKVILRNSQLLLMENSKEYIALFPSYQKIYELHMEKSSPKAYIYCANIIDAVLKEELFHTLRVAYLQYALSQGLFMLHSASVCYRDKAWLFSGPSGTGKSTHTRLWLNVPNTSLLNGDLNLIGIRNAVPTVYGTPWCGTSGIFCTGAYPLGGILLLQQSKSDFCEPLSKEQQVLQILLRCISPVYQELFLEKHIDIINALTEKIFICRLHCTPTKNALETSRAAIDQYLDKSTL